VIAVVTLSRKKESNFGSEATFSMTEYLSLFLTFKNGFKVKSGKLFICWELEPIDMC
jgi:hypothetical protein